MLNHRTPQCAATCATHAPPSPFPQYSFGPHPIPGSHVFALTPLSYAFVNLKPVVPGGGSWGGAVTGNVIMGCDDVGRQVVAPKP